MKPSSSKLDRLFAGRLRQRWRALIGEEIGGACRAWRPATRRCARWVCSGNDLHYRGYDILEIAERCEFEEIAHLLIHERWPTRAELAAYKERCSVARLARGAAHRARAAARREPSDGCAAHRRIRARLPRARDPRTHAAGRRAPSPTGCSPRCRSMLCYWYHYAAAMGGASRCETADDSIAAHFLHLLHGQPASALWVAPMQTSLILYAEHEFNASTFTARVIAGTGSDLYSCITGAIGALRGPKHGGANEVAFEIQQRYGSPRCRPKRIFVRASQPRKSSSASAIRSTRLHDPRSDVIKRVARRLRRRAARCSCFAIAERIESVMQRE